MTKRELVDMFKNIIFPKQAEDLLKINYEGLGELDKREYLRDTSILIMLAEKGLKSEQEIVKPYLEKLKSEIEKIPTTTPIMYGNCTRGYEIEHPREIKRKAMNMIDNLLSESEGKE